MKMHCSFSTDYLADFHYNNSPEAMLAPIEAAGIKEIFWTQQGEGDFIYMKPEMREIELCVKRHNLTVDGVAAPHVPGPMRNCWSEDELKRKSGIRLIENRMELAERLGAPLVWLPAPSPLPCNKSHLMQTMERLLIAAKRHHITLAVESCREDELAFLLDNYPDDNLGWSMQTALCGLTGAFVPLLKRFGPRLALLRAGDAKYGMLRRIPFSGCLEWQKMLSAVKAVAPEAMITLDVDVYSHLECSQMEFLTRSRKAGEQLTVLWEDSIS